jgi:hypothetical protein
VPFKSNSVAGEAGSLWEKMFHFFQFQREQFLAHYHKRQRRIDLRDGEGQVRGLRPQ